jgi:hypothetical protein
VRVTEDCTPQESSLPITQPNVAAEVGQPVPTLTEVSAPDTPHVETVNGPPSSVVLPRSMRTTPLLPAETANVVQEIAPNALLWTTLAAGMEPLMPEPDTMLTIGAPQNGDCVAVGVTGGVPEGVAVDVEERVVEEVAVPLGDAVIDTEAPGDSVPDADAVLDAVAVPVGAMLAVDVAVADGVGLNREGVAVRVGVGGT